jgi:hypothetical protein
LALNSYENRVYQIGIEDGDPVVAKFYRPERWSDAAIREEHAFAGELAAAGNSGGGSAAARRAVAACHEGFRYAVFPRRGGAGRNWATRRSRMGGPVSGPHPCGRPGRPLSERTRSTWTDLGRNARDSCSTAIGCRTIWPTKYADLTDELLDEVEARAGGWGGARLGRILAIVTAGIFCGRMPGRTSSIWTIA